MESLSILHDAIERIRSLYLASHFPQIARDYYTIFGRMITLEEVPRAVEQLKQIMPKIPAHLLDSLISLLRSVLESRALGVPVATFKDAFNSILMKIRSYLAPYDIDAEFRIKEIEDMIEEGTILSLRRAILIAESLRQDYCEQEPEQTLSTKIKTLITLIESAPKSVDAISALIDDIKRTVDALQVETLSRLGKTGKEEGMRYYSGGTIKAVGIDLPNEIKRAILEVESAIRTGRVNTAVAKARKALDLAYLFETMRENVDKIKITEGTLAFTSPYRDELYQHTIRVRERILDFLSKNKRKREIKASEIAKKLGISFHDVWVALNELKEEGILDWRYTPDKADKIIILRG